MASCCLAQQSQTAEKSKQYFYYRENNINVPNTVFTLCNIDENSERGQI